MGVIVKKLDRMQAVTFEGFQPNPEDKAFEAFGKWKRILSSNDLVSRVFGHNINLDGSISYDPQNEGYKVFAVLAAPSKDNPIPNVETVEAGKFVVTGIEGSFEEDPEGTWIMEGWEKMNQMIEKKNYTIKKPVRWYEEHLEPANPAKMRLDLYLEIE